MRFIFFSPVHFEHWDWRNSVEKGIGGSETSHVEMAWRLRRRGHEIISYAPIPEDCPGEWRGTKWYRYEKADFSLPGVWIVYRAPQMIEAFLPKRPDQKLWLMMQDWNYDWTKEAIEGFDKIIVLSEVHKRWLIEQSPEVEQKVWVTSNGLKPDLIDEVEAEGVPERNPRRIMYASSPDRGLDHLLSIFTRVREIVPDAELHTFYGFNNLDKLIAQEKVHPSYREQKERIVKLSEQPGVVAHGRVSQKELYREWMKSAIWCYPSEFWETSCITCMEAQAMGAVPVINPVWAQGENTRYGVHIQGNPYTDALTRARFAAELAVLLQSPGRQAEIRKPMMADARKRWDWENFVSQWEEWASESVGVPVRECRVCGSTELTTAVDLGTQSLATFFPQDGERVPSAPLRVVKCQCGLHQLDFTAHRSLLFGKDYGYRSGINGEMLLHLHQLARQVKRLSGPGDLVIDIGANDGTLLAAVGEDRERQGFEPCDAALHSQVPLEREFFSAKLARGKAKVITSVAMFYDLEDPVEFCRDIAAALHPDGTWINELQYLPKCQLDTICHEHLTYWRLADLKAVYEKAGLSLNKVEFNSANGGSIRTFASHPKPTIGGQAWAEIEEALKKEPATFTFDPRQIRHELLALLHSQSEVYGYGASTKGNVLLQYCRIGQDLVKAIADKNPDKWGRKTSTGIPIISEDTLRLVRPEAVLALPWSFIEEFRRREPWATWIVPFPRPHVIEAKEKSNA